MTVKLEKEEKRQTISSPEVLGNWKLTIVLICTAGKVHLCTSRGYQMPQHETFIFTEDKAQTNLTHKLALARASNHSTRDLQLDWTQVQTVIYRPTKLHWLSRFIALLFNKPFHSSQTFLRMLMQVTVTLSLDVVGWKCPNREARLPPTPHSLLGHLIWFINAPSRPSGPVSHR